LPAEIHFCSLSCLIGKIKVKAITLIIGVTKILNDIGVTKEVILYIVKGAKLKNINLKL